MPKTSLEKLQAERRQLHRSFVRTYNDTSRLLTEHAISDEDLSPLKSAAAALNQQFQECQILDKEIRSIALDEIQDEEEQDAFFDEATEVTNLNRGKISKVIFRLKEFEKNSQAYFHRIEVCTPSIRSKLPDLQLPTFHGKITDWNGFWERFQSQVGNIAELSNSSKFIYLIGQLRGEELKTVQGTIPSEQNYSVLEETLQQNLAMYILPTAPKPICRSFLKSVNLK